MKDPYQPLYIGELQATWLGDLWAAQSPAGLVAISLWGDRNRFVNEVIQLTGKQPEYAPQHLAQATSQLAEFLDGKRKKFTIPIDWSVMTPFQKMVLEVVSRIEYGRTQTYSEIARQIGKPKAVRAVGRANATNPIPIMIPCHRVLGSDGRLHGYSAPGGVETKARLLRLEGSCLI